MPSVINTNMPSLNAQRNLTKSQDVLSQTLQRLSSGLRINSAKDDAAGLAISERFTTQIRGVNQAARNANDGISLAQTAEGALGEISNNLQRIRELAVQSRNATNSGTDRAAMQSEVTQLMEEIGRIADQTEFNGIKLLDGSFTTQAFQVGANQGDRIDIASIVNAKVANLGTWNSVGTTTPAVAGSYTVASLSSYDFSDTTVEGVPTTSGTSGAFTKAVAGDADETFTFTVGGVDILSVTSAAADDEVTAGDIDTALETQSVLDDLEAAGISFTGKAADGDLAFTKADGTDMTIAIASDYATAAGSFATAGFVGDHTDGTEASGTNLNAGFSVDGIAVALTTDLTDVDTLVQEIQDQLDDGGTAGTYLVAANGTGISITSTVAGATNPVAITGAAASATNSGVFDGGTEVAGEDEADVAGAAQTGFASLTIANVAGADNAMLAMDGALNAVNSARADLGAIQNRFGSVVTSLITTAENLVSARSRIQDTDFAAETAALTRAQILQQAGTAMLAQANSLPNTVLSLLQG
jgi:flagellin